MHNIVENSTIEELWKKVIVECKDKVLENVLLNGEFSIDEINSRFIELHQTDALKWQKKNKPDDLIINHGEYIHKGHGANLGIDFIIKELKLKNYGNRACYSLINMDDIIDSGDKVIPSFMILQFSFAKESKDKLLVSAYFRALEVKKFLPINLTEICLNIQKISKQFPNIKKFELNIFAFRAQYIEDFNCLKHSKLDNLKATKMVTLLIKDKTYIIEALKDKQRIVESVITKTGIENLKEAVEAIDEEDLKDKINLQNQINIILSIMDNIITIRENTSIQNQITKETEKLKEELGKLIRLMEVGQ